MGDDQPLSMRDSGIAMHELFVSLCAAGFTEAQAIQLVIGMTRPQ